MTRYLKSTASLVILSFIIYFCAFAVVCNLHGPFGYYALRLTGVDFSDYYAAGLMIGYSAVLVYIFSLWTRIVETDPSFFRYLSKPVFAAVSFAAAILIILGIVVLYLRIHLVITIVIVPFAVYCVFMLWFLCFMEIIRSYKAILIWPDFFIQFPPDKSIGFSTLFLLCVSLFAFIYELFADKNKSLIILLIIMLIIAGITFLASHLTKFSKIKAAEYEEIMGEKLKSERLKTELITNVSHDIKTPLTSIINYSNIIGEMDIQNSELKEYTCVLINKSVRLKALIEDLIEASKAGTGNISVCPEKIDLSELFGQLAGEFEELLYEKNLQIIREVESPAFISADGRHLWRVMENVFGNAVKYSLSGTRIYTSVKKDKDRTVFSMKNISKEPLNISPDELTEQFVRGDRARHTEGSGLGLYIAKSLTEAMGGELVISITGDLFEITISFGGCHNISQPSGDFLS